MPASELTPEEFSRQMFELERSFHKQLVAESDRATRKKLYADFYGRLTEFTEQHQPGKKNFGSFSPELMQLLIPFVRGKTVLDFGCGYGFATFDLALYAQQVLAVDESKPMIEDLQGRVTARGIKNIETVFLAGNPEQALAGRQARMDVVYSNDVAEHLHPEDMMDHLALTLRLLRPGGLYICITPNRVSGPHDVSGAFLPYHSRALGAHICEYTYRELRDVFRKAGFAKFRTPITAMGYHRLRSDAAYRRLLVPPHFKFMLESLWFGHAKHRRPKLLNLFCLNKVVLFAWKP